MVRNLMAFVLVGIFPLAVFGAQSTSSIWASLEKDCSVSTPGAHQIKTCSGPAGFQAIIHQTPMGEQLTLENSAHAFSAGVIRCEKGQRITDLGWRLMNGKPFAAIVGYQCIGLPGQSRAGASKRILVQGLKGFEQYGHEVRPAKGGPTRAGAEALADSWLKAK